MAGECAAGVRYKRVMEKTHMFIQQRCSILPYLVGQGLEAKHDMASSLLSCCFPDLFIKNLQKYSDCSAVAKFPKICIT